MTLLERGKKHEMLEYLEQDLPGPGSTSFTRQQEPLGLGHAVWCARELVGHEPFALLLPDVLVQHERGCLAQMIDAARELGEQRQYRRRRGGAARAREQYGVVGVGERKGKVFAITSMVEKPTRERGAVEPHHHRPLHPAAGDLRDLSETQAARRRRRNPAHRRHDRAGAHPAVLRLEIRRPQLRLRLEDRLSRRQRRPTRSRAPTSRRASAPRSRKSSTSSTAAHNVMYARLAALSAASAGRRGTRSRCRQSPAARTSANPAALPP